MRYKISLALVVVCLQTASAQNVGIGTKAPTGPLSFGAVTPYYYDRIIAFGNNSAGIGAPGNDLTFSVGPVAGSIVFGQGSSTAFTPAMRIQSDGNVGIAVAKATQPLDVGNRIRSRWSNTTLTPGVVTSYTDRDGNALLPFFTGLADLTSVVMIGGGKGVLRYEGNYGALGLNLSYGFAGQVAVSNGNTNTATWQTMPSYGFTYNNAAYYFETNNYSLTDAAPSATLTSFNVPVALGKNGKLFIDYSIAANTTACANCKPILFYVDVSVNGTLVNESFYEIGNGRSTTACDGILVPVGPNSTVSVLVGKYNSGPVLNLPASAGRTSSIVIWPVPQN